MPATHSRATALSTERRLVYADSSALVKLVIEEAESEPLKRYVANGSLLATSRVALVEVSRATSVANPAPEVQREVRRMLSSCLLVEVHDGVLRAAAALASRAVRTLDAIHLATALRVEADELLAYDRRLTEAAAERGLRVATPGRPA